MKTQVTASAGCCLWHKTQAKASAIQFFRRRRQDTLCRHRSALCRNHTRRAAQLQKRPTALPRLRVEDWRSWSSLTSSARCKKLSPTWTAVTDSQAHIVTRTTLCRAQAAAGAAAYVLCVASGGSTPLHVLVACLRVRMSVFARRRHADVEQCSDQGLDPAKVNLLQEPATMPRWMIP